MICVPVVEATRSARRAAMAAVSFSCSVAAAGRNVPATASAVSSREGFAHLWQCRIVARSCARRDSSLLLAFGVRSAARLDSHGRERSAGGCRSCRALSQAAIGAGGETEERARLSLKDLAESLVLPSGFLSNLPNDLRVDLNDAAFALASGQVKEECGEKVGGLLVTLSQAWEQADTQAAAAVAKEVPLLQDYVSSDKSKAAVGKRLQAAGRYLRSTGSYGDGELERISRALVTAGGAISFGVPEMPAPQSSGSRILKFGDLQVQITKPNAYIGAVIGLGFGILCWQLTSSLASTTISESQFPNSRSFAIATSLRGTLLAAGYFCSAISVITMAGLIALTFQMGPEESSQR